VIATWVYIAIGAAMVALALVEAWGETADIRALRRRHWPANIALAVINGGIVLLVPLGTVSGSVFAEAQGLGLMAALGVTGVWQVIGSILVLTFATYAIHRAFHQIPILWRLHRIHHCDVEIDATTAVRHHPIEILLSALAMVVFVVAFGVDPATAMVLSLVDQAWAVWTHSSKRLPKRLHEVVCWVFVTPHTHMAHHSNDVRETDTNYGNTTTIWDRLFGTHLVYPIRDAAEFRTGLDEYSRDEADDLDFLLRLPFERRKEGA